MGKTWLPSPRHRRERPPELEEPQRLLRVHLDRPSRHLAWRSDAPRASLLLSPLLSLPEFLDVAPAWRSSGRGRTLGESCRSAVPSVRPSVLARRRSGPHENFLHFPLSSIAAIVL